ncbi:MAG: hypothetical protein ACE5GQ_11980 [Nitrospinales bacterium]
MFVNIARNKLLINKNRIRRKAVKNKIPSPRCNHCGGLVRIDDEFPTCMMCSRTLEHVCGNCSYASPAKVAGSKKSA